MLVQYFKLLVREANFLTVMAASPLLFWMAHTSLGWREAATFLSYWSLILMVVALLIINRSNDPVRLLNIHSPITRIYSTILLLSLLRLVSSLPVILPLSIVISKGDPVGVALSITAVMLVSATYEDRTLSLASLPLALSAAALNAGLPIAILSLYPLVYSLVTGLYEKLDSRVLIPSTNASFNPALFVFPLLIILLLSPLTWYLVEGTGTHALLRPGEFLMFNPALGRNPLGFIVLAAMSLLLIFTPFLGLSGLREPDYYTRDVRKLVGGTPWSLRLSVLASSTVAGFGLFLVALELEEVLGVRVDVDPFLYLLIPLAASISHTLIPTSLEGIRGDLSSIALLIFLSMLMLSPKLREDPESLIFILFLTILAYDLDILLEKSKRWVSFVRARAQP